MAKHVGAVTSLAELQDYLSSRGVAYRAVPDLDALELTIDQPPLSGSLVVVWDKRAPVVQLIVPLPFAVPNERVPAMESALVRLNHALVCPGFGFNHERLAAYYRFVMLRRAADGSVPTEDLSAALAAAAATAHDCFGALQGVAFGRAAELVVEDVQTAVDLFDAT